MKNYVNEMEGQLDFYKRFNLDVEYMLNNDGIYKGVLFENKLRIDNIGKVVLQLIKYASKLRMLGKLLPEKLIANDLCNETAYIINSKDFLEDIEKVYLGASSLNNEGFLVDSDKYMKISYDNIEGIGELVKVISEAGYTKYHVDFSNILSLSKEFYKVNSSKDDFLMGDNCEIRKPKVLADRILPYTKKDNHEFSKIMDCLNSKALQAELGAYYTPEAYVKKSQEMLLNRIEELKKVGLDYIVIDRAAGVGNLFEGLPDEVLSHCVLSTIEPNEYLILQERFLGKSVVVVPPTDALAYDIIPTEVDGEGNILSDLIREKVNDPNCAIILYENPPYNEAGGLTLKGNSNNKSPWKNSFVCKEMIKEVGGVVSNDLANLFIWSAFNFYMKKPVDSYIVYSPVKYWKQQDLVNKNIYDSFVCNRKHFHAKESSIICTHWSNIDNEIESFKSSCFDIIKENNEDKIIESGEIIINKVYNPFSKNFDKRKFEDDLYDGILCEGDGTEFKKGSRKIRNGAIYNKNIIGYMYLKSFDVSHNSSNITIGGKFDGNGFFLRNDNYLEKLPMFCASVSRKFFKWYEKGLICKTYDGKGSYKKNKEFLKKCLIYTGLSFDNKCRSLNGSDKRFYRNEMCFDKDTLFSKELKNYTLTDEEKYLLKLYNQILDFSKSCEEYNNDYTYGTFQIEKEINVNVIRNIVTKQGVEVKKSEPKYSELNSLILILKEKLKTYFKNNIYEDLFKYELLK